MSTKLKVYIFWYIICMRSYLTTSCKVFTTFINHILFETERVSQDKGLFVTNTQKSNAPFIRF